MRNNGVCCITVLFAISWHTNCCISASLFNDTCANKSYGQSPYYIIPTKIAWLKLSGRNPHGPGNSTLKFKIMLESKPLKQIMLVGRLGVASWTSTFSRTKSVGASSHMGCTHILRLWLHAVLYIYIYMYMCIHIGTIITIIIIIIIIMISIILFTWGARISCGSGCMQHVHIRTSPGPLSLSLYIYIYVYLYTYIYIYISLYLSLSIHIYIYIYVYVCMCIYIYIYIYMWVEGAQGETERTN